MGEKSYSLENPSPSTNRSTKGYLTAISVILIIFALVFVGYYFLFLPYHDDSDLDDIFSYSTDNVGLKASPTDNLSSTETTDGSDEEVDIFDNDFIGTTLKSTELSVESEELISSEYSDYIVTPEGSGDDDISIETDHDTPSCSKSFIIQEYSTKVCLVAEPKTQKDAAQYCEQSGMQLLNIPNDGMKHKVFDRTQKLFGVGGGTALWIDGKWNEYVLIWESLHDGSEILVAPSETMLGDCSRIYSPPHGEYEVLSSNCNKKSYFYCEKLILD